MTSRAYNLVAAAALLAGLAGAAGTWIMANRIYAGGNQVAGWRLGMAGVALPALCLLACEGWLGWRRRRGDPMALVGWLRGALALSVFGWVGLFLFSLM
ncbi:MAG: hypothetical protein AB7I33_05910 [Gemmatimonadales bacterium]